MKYLLFFIAYILLIAPPIHVQAQEDETAQEDRVHPTPTSLAALLPPEGLSEIETDNYYVSY